MGGILNHRQAVFPGNPVDFLHFTGLASEMDRDNGFGLGSYFTLYLCWINIISYGINVCKYRPPAAVQHTVSRCRKSNWGSNHLIPWRNARRQAGNVESRRAIRDGNGIFRADIVRCFLLKFADGRPCCQVVRTQHVYDCLDIFFCYGLMSVWYVHGKYSLSVIRLFFPFLFLERI